MKILFLCTELAGYFINCIQVLSLETSAEIKILHWPVVKSAPFDFKPEGIVLVDKSKLSSQEVYKTCIEFKPALVYVAGWVDKDYLKVAKKLKQQGSNIVGGLDNEWRGTFKQKLSVLLSRWIVKPYFDFLWVAGNKQYQFAQRLGYSHDHILMDIYTADVKRFFNKDKVVFNKSLLFVGRFEREKGVELLVQVFSNMTEEERNGWKLRMIGNGSLRQHIRSSDILIVEDFMQPEDLAVVSRDGGGFILPSFEEPWGVVVHEFAAAGLPLILSNRVNAGEKFLIHNYNGFSFESNASDKLKDTLKHYFELDSNSLALMGRRSQDLALSVTPELWVARFMSVMK